MVSMVNLGIAEAFARYGATLKNTRWAVSARTPNAEIVISCWEEFLKRSAQTLVYDDTLTRWGDINPNGRALLTEHLTEALSMPLAVRLVIAKRAKAGSERIAESFSVRTDLIGKVTSFDGDRFVLTFSR